MKRISFVSLAVSAFLFLSVAAHAAAPSKQRVEGDSAVLSFFTSDSTGCGYTGAFVSVYETVTHSAGAVIHQTWLYVDYYSYDDCTLSYVNAFGSFELAPGEISFQSGQKARIQKSLVLSDNYYSQATVPLTLDLTWTGTGERIRSSHRQSLHSATGRHSTHFRGVSREAQVTGSFVINSTNLLAQATSTTATLTDTSLGTTSHN